MISISINLVVDAGAFHTRQLHRGEELLRDAVLRYLSSANRKHLSSETLRSALGRKEDVGTCVSNGNCGSTLVYPALQPEVCFQNAIWSNRWLGTLLLNRIRLLRNTA